MVKKIFGVVVGMMALGVLADNVWHTNARKSPEWFTKGVICQIQPRAFTPEGTLKAAEAKLPYLKDSGFTILYLVPVVKMDDDMNKEFWSPRQVKSGFNCPRNQYRMADYFHVDPEYGTDQDLKDFVATAHKLGMYVMFDLVYLHCGPTAPMLKEHPEFTYWNADGTVKKGPWRFPKLNFDEPKLREYLIGNMRYLLTQYGCDGFRCDVGDQIPLDFWCDARDMMDAVTARHAAMICEGENCPNQQKAFDADYGWFPCEVFQKDGKRDARCIRRRWEKREGNHPYGARFMNHYDNHDIVTDVRPRRENAFGHAAMDQVCVWLFTADGIPMLFNGNEFAEADEKHSMFGRTPLDWSALETDYGKYRHELVKKLSAIRQAHPAFTAASGRNAMVWLETSLPDDVTAFIRRGKGETMFVVQNWADKPLTVSVDFGRKAAVTESYVVTEEPDRSLRGAFAAEPLISRDAEKTGANEFKLGPYGFAVLEVKED